MKRANGHECGVFFAGDLVVSKNQPEPFGQGVIVSVDADSGRTIVEHRICGRSARVQYGVEELSLMARPNVNDVAAFHHKFGLTNPRTPGEPIQLDKPTYEFRRDFMREELEEFEQGYEEGNLAKQADALIDLTYVVLGTALMMRLPWQPLWDEVQRANMTKERSTGSKDKRSKRGNSLDVVKPKGWTPPDIEGVLARAGRT
jgi:predicted HAD superfamily Cof-like phosphohydrolase